MLTSALLAVESKENPLGFDNRLTFCVLLVDGLGYHNLVEAGGHARFLNSQTIEKTYCHFPATTSTSLTSLATGKTPSETGFIGYNIFNRLTAERMNLLSGWNDQESAREFQTLPTVSDLAVELGIAFDVVSQATYENTGLTAATMPAATFNIANSLEERFRVALDLVSRNEPRIVYLYVPELDQTAHGLGVGSSKWLQGVEEVDSLIRDFVALLPKHAGLVVTSDHGLIDVTEFEKIYLDEVLPEQDMQFVGGDTRGLMVYLADSNKSLEYMNHVQAAVGEYCYVVNAEELQRAGYLADLGARPEIVPDFWIIAKKNVALYHRAFARPKSLFNVGHHGAFSEREMAIPLIRFNC